MRDISFEEFEEGRRKQITRKIIENLTDEPNPKDCKVVNFDLARRRKLAKEILEEFKD